MFETTQAIEEALTEVLRPFWGGAGEAGPSDRIWLVDRKHQQYADIISWIAYQLSSSAKLPSGRYLCFAEREEIGLLRAQGHGMREIARRIGRAASTISRELCRNAATRSGGFTYRATTAQCHADRAARRPKPIKLTTNAKLRLR